MAKKNLPENKNFRLLVFDKNGRFAKPDGRKIQKIIIQNKRTKEVIELGYGKAKSKNINNIKKTISKTFAKVKDGFWRDVLGRKAEVKQRTVKSKKRKPILSKKTNRYRDKIFGFETVAYTFTDRINIKEAIEFGQKVFGDVGLLLWIFTDSVEKYPVSVSSGDFRVNDQTEISIRFLANEMQDRMDFLLEIFAGYGKKLIFKNSLLKITWEKSKE